MPRSARAVLAVATAVVALGGTGVVQVGPARAQAPAADDPGLSRQWSLERIGAADAWEVATGEGVTIAIVDSGINIDHPDLRDKIDAIADCVGHDDEPSGCVDGAGLDDAGHGTHVAGIAAASSGNGEGIAGVAPMARLLSVKVLSADCVADESGCEAEGTESDVADGIRWAVDQGADVINLSLGSVAQAVVGPGRSFGAALDYAWENGAIAVLVAGNDLLLPGSVVDVPAVVVAATDGSDGRASYSNGVGNVRWAVAAPGGEEDSAETCAAPTPNGILSTFYRPPAAAADEGTSGYACVAGTSMAAPHVSGALAVLLSAGFSHDEAVERLLSSAEDLGPPGPDSTFGSGRIDLAAALDGVAPTGQPLAAAGSVGPATTDVTTSTTTTAPPAEVDPNGDPVDAPTGTTSSTSTTVSFEVADPNGDADAADDGDDNGDDDGDEAAGSPTAPSAGGSGAPGSTASLAVLAVVAVLTAHALRYLSTASWACRTPDR